MPALNTLPLIPSSQRGNSTPFVLPEASIQPRHRLAQGIANEGILHLHRVPRSLAPSPLSQMHPPLSSSHRTFRLFFLLVSNPTRFGIALAYDKNAVATLLTPS